MSHIPYTICRSGTYYHNRRVPKHAVKAYGLFIRQALSKCAEKAEAYAFKVKHTWLISRKRELKQGQKGTLLEQNR